MFNEHPRATVDRLKQIRLKTMNRKAVLGEYNVFHEMRNIPISSSKIFD